MKDTTNKYIMYTPRTNGIYTESYGNRVTTIDETYYTTTAKSGPYIKDMQLHLSDKSLFEEFMSSAFNRGYCA